MFETAESAQRKMEQARKKEKGRAAFGWDVFNQDALFKAYKKRLGKLPTVGERERRRHERTNERTAATAG